MKIAETPYKCNREGLGALIKEARGTRTLKEYAADSGVSYSSISRAESDMTYMPSANMLAKITSPDAKPQGNVRLRELLVAAGYIDPDSAKGMHEYENNERLMELLEVAKHIDLNNTKEISKSNEGGISDNKDKPSIWGPIDNFLESIVPRDDLNTLRDYSTQRKRIKTTMQAILCNALANKGIPFTISKDRFLHVGNKVVSYTPDVILNLNTDNRVNTWLWDFVPKPLGHSLSTTDPLAPLITIPPNDTYKISVILTSKDDYDYIRRYHSKETISLREELSIILLDLDEMRVVEETYLSNYYIGDTSQEFFIDDKYEH